MTSHECQLNNKKNSGLRNIRSLVVFLQLSLCIARPTTSIVVHITHLRRLQHQVVSLETDKLTEPQTWISLVLRRLTATTSPQTRADRRTKEPSMVSWAAVDVTNLRVHTLNILSQAESSHTQSKYGLPPSTLPGCIPPPRRPCLLSCRTPSLLSVLSSLRLSLGWCSPIVLEGLKPRFSSSCPRPSPSWWWPSGGCATPSHASSSELRRRRGGVSEC